LPNGTPRCPPTRSSTEKRSSRTTRSACCPACPRPSARSTAWCSTPCAARG